MLGAPLVPDFVEHKAAERELLARRRLHLESRGLVKTNGARVAGHDPERDRSEALRHDAVEHRAPQPPAHTGRPDGRRKIKGHDLGGIVWRAFVARRPERCEAEHLARGLCDDQFWTPLGNTFAPHGGPLVDGQRVEKCLRQDVAVGMLP